MKPKYSNLEYIKSKSTDLLPLECYSCGETFYLMKKLITHEIKHNRGRCKFCNQNCNNTFNNVETKIESKCVHCHKSIKKSPSQVKKSKSGNNFCSRSCSMIFNNKHKTFGNRRSKLEIYLQEQLTSFFPDLEIYYNSKHIINSELDIYVPSLKIGFELNGVFHYEPIYGKEKLTKIQNNDERKFQACIENGISLCVIDTSQQKYFKEKSSKKYLNIITTIINQRTMLNS